ncbi:uncharacterized protein FYW47_003414 [Aplochiton taeniatus]
MSQENQNPISHLPRFPVLSEVLAPRLNHSGRRGAQHLENCLCLQGRIDSRVTADVCCLGVSKPGPPIVKKSLYGKEKSCKAIPTRYEEIALTSPSATAQAAAYATRTNVPSHADQDCLRYTLASGPQLKNNYLPRTPFIASLCTLLQNAKLKPNLNHSVRLCHGQGPTKYQKPHLKNGPKAAVIVADTPKSDDPVPPQLTHTDAQGRASMVDVSGKASTLRTATARATVNLGPTAFQLLRDNQLAKGDALAVAQLAGIMASKMTSALIPLCHPLPLDQTAVTFDLNVGRSAAVVTATCRTTGRTGVEMEALTAVSMAALTLYDMCKAVTHDIVITDIELVSKTGGKRDFQRLA